MIKGFLSNLKFVKVFVSELWKEECILQIHSSNFYIKVMLNVAKLGWWSDSSSRAPA
jgi:hypothetical protein